MVLVVRRSVQRTPERLQQEMEQVFRALVPARPNSATRESGLWRPPVEVFETEDALVVSAEIAGMDERELSVVIEHDVLSIRGERMHPRTGERRIYREAGIAYGRFGADVFVPFAVEADKTEAEYEGGILRIRLPKAAARTILPRRDDLAEVQDQRNTES